MNTPSARTPLIADISIYNYFLRKNKNGEEDLKINEDPFPGIYITEGCWLGWGMLKIY